MRLLLLSSNFPNPCEPTRAVFNLQLARGLVRNHALRVIAPVPWVDEWRARSGSARIAADRRAVIDGIEVHHPRYYYPPGVLRGTHGWWFWRSVRKTVSRTFRSWVPDAVIGYWIHPDGRAAVEAARAAGAPSAVIVGGSDILLLPPGRARRKRVLDVLRDTDAVVTVNRHLKEKVLEHGIPENKVHVWHQGVDTERFRPGARGAARLALGLPVEGRMILWVGRMVPVKGLDVLLRACAALPAGTPPFHLHLVGDGPLRGELEAEVARLGLSGAVTFVGTRAPEQLADWYRAADLTVLPSRSEGLPNVLRESLACGTPFVASAVGGIPEIATEPCLRLVPPGDPVALAHAIRAALTAPATAPATCSTSWTESAEALVRILEPLVSSSAGRRNASRARHAVLR